MYGEEGPTIECVGQTIGPAQYSILNFEKISYRIKIEVSWQFKNGLMIFSVLVDYLHFVSFVSKNAHSSLSLTTFWHCPCRDRVLIPPPGAEAELTLPKVESFSGSGNIFAQYGQPLEVDR